jgi:hypothetical protein
MSQVREAARRLEKLEAVTREQRAQLERVGRASIDDPEFSRLVKLYSDLALAADPMKGRPTESGGSCHPDDRPLIYLATQKARQRKRQVDRGVRGLSRFIDQSMDESEPDPPGDACPCCGSQVDRQGRPPNRRRLARLFLEQNLQAGPVREEHVRAAAQSQSVAIAQSTLRRAADELGVVRFDEDGMRWWRLP